MLKQNTGKIFDNCNHNKRDKFRYRYSYEGWNFNSGNYLFTTDTK